MKPIITQQWNQHPHNKQAINSLMGMANRWDTNAETSKQTTNPITKHCNKNNCNNYNTITIHEILERKYYGSVYQYSNCLYHWYMANLFVVHTAIPTIYFGYFVAQPKRKSNIVNTQ